MPIIYPPELLIIGWLLVSLAVGSVIGRALTVRWEACPEVPRMRVSTAARVVATVVNEDGHEWLAGVHEGVARSVRDEIVGREGRSDACSGASGNLGKAEYQVRTADSANVARIRPTPDTHLVLSSVSRCNSGLRPSLPTKSRRNSPALERRC